MKKVAAAAATVGFVVAISAGRTWFFIYGQGLGGTSSARLFARIVTYLWPTSIIMMDAERLGFGTVLLFLMSSVENAVFYGMLACSIYAAIKRVSQARRARLS